MQASASGSSIRWSTVAVLLPLLSISAHGVPQPDTWYIGAKAGWVAAYGACESHTIDCDNDLAGGGLFGGYELNNWLAFEVGYDYLGDIKATYPAIGFSAQTADYKSQIQGLEFVAKPYWRISDNWSLFGKAGMLLWNVDVTGHEVNFTHDASDSDGSPLLGAGVEYFFNRNWSTTLEYQWVNNVGGRDTGGMDLNVVNVGVIYRFASALAPAPVLAAEPVTPLTTLPTPVIYPQESWSLKGPSFANDASALTSEMKVALQPAFVRLQSSPHVHLNIHTHTDSRGSFAYNQHLSDRRAQSVLAYFMSHGVQATQLTAKGMGESHPIADNRTDEGRHQNRRVALESPTFTIALPISGGQPQ